MCRIKLGEHSLDDYIVPGVALMEGWKEYKVIS